MVKYYYFAVLIVITESRVRAQIVDIPSGKLQGKQTDYGVQFEGIPYAAPPIGEDRYELPKPFVDRWEGVRDATAPRNICIQWDMFYGTEDDRLHGDEDCLYLNVYTPKIGGIERYDVIVYIHGGAFMFGSGSDNRPNLLLKYRNVVFVTINYRLGPMGFLCTPDNVIPCNLGLKDQNEALWWVKSNIYNFNGNSERITITGYSAGGASVHLHMLSPISRGLFRTAVSHSGSAFCPWASVKNPLPRAKRMGAYLGCPTEDTRLLKRCLKTKDAKDIVRAVKKFQPFMYNPFMVFAPTIEKPGTPNAFITEKLEDIISSGRSANVPWVVAMTQEEGGFNAATLMQRDATGNEVINTFGEIWPLMAAEMMFYNETIDFRYHNLKAESLKRSYLGREEFSVATYRKTQKMFSDMLFFRGIDKAIKMHTKYTSLPVYVYRYNKTYTGGIARLMSNNANIDFGSIHGDDVYHIFVTVYVDQSVFDEKDDQITQNLVQLYGTLSRNYAPIFGNIALPRTNKFDKKIKLLQINDADDYKVIEVKSLYQ